MTTVKWVAFAGALLAVAPALAKDKPASHEKPPPSIIMKPNPFIEPLLAVPQTIPAVPFPISEPTTFLPAPADKETVERILRESAKDKKDKEDKVNPNHPPEWAPWVEPKHEPKVK